MHNDEYTFAPSQHVKDMLIYFNVLHNSDDHIVLSTHTTQNYTNIIICKQEKYTNKF